MTDMPVNWTALWFFIFFFALVTVVGFFAARWRSGNLDQLDEWGLGGRRFGTVVTWFLIGGDFYTAYTVIAVPAAVFGVGAAGFFALPYTILVYPIVFLTMPRLWAVARRHGYVTTADFIGGRYGSHWLTLAVAFTGLLATMPYIALQLVGMEVVIKAMGIGAGGGWEAELPLGIAFVILALYTYKSGLRAPALIALVKDVMIYIVVIVAVTYIPYQLGGYGAMFDKADAALTAKASPGFLVLQPGGFAAYATLALGSALAAFCYPHTVTSILSSSSGAVIRRNAALLPAYTFLLGLIALLGIMAIAAGVTPSTPSNAVPALFIAMFPPWFVGFGFAAIAIGALVPAAIMSIAAANLWTRNVYKAYINPNATHKQESSMAKLVSLVVKLGAIAFILFIPTQYAINLQLLGGIWILQTLPALFFGLFTRWFHHRALLIGWAVGMVMGTWMAYSLAFKGAVFTFHIGDGKFTSFAGLWALGANLIVSAVLTLVFDAMKSPRHADKTSAADYNDLTELPAPTEPLVGAH
ncbi:sodium:solute symporter [soil metagenome]